AGWQPPWSGGRLPRSGGGRPVGPAPTALRGRSTSELVVQVTDRLSHVPQRLRHLGDTLGGVLQATGQVVVAVLELAGRLLGLEAVFDELIDVALALGERVVDALLAVVQLASAGLHLVVCCTEVGHEKLPS